MPQVQLPRMNDTEAREAFSSAAALAREQVFPSGFSGTGIVIPAGGEVYFPNAWVCVHRLRALGCRLPIEIWHLGEQEVRPEWRDWLADFDVRFVDAHGHLSHHPHRGLAGWPLKAYALLWSSFTCVLLIDADNSPVKDPTFLFSEPEFIRTGSVFWPDLWTMEDSHSIWNLCGIPPRDEREFESGQILVDKARCWPALWLANWMNEHSDTWYHYLHGDKDTFRMAWHRLGSPLGMPSSRMPDMPGRKYIRQFDFTGDLLFQHRCAAKWRRDSQNERLPTFRHESECLQAIDALRGRYAALLRSEFGNKVDALCSRDWVLSTNGGTPSAKFQFHPDGSIVGGPTSAVWWSTDGGKLNLHDAAFRSTVTLLLNTEGAWVAESGGVSVAILTEVLRGTPPTAASPSTSFQKQKVTMPPPHQAKPEPLDLITLAKSSPGALTVVDVGCRWGFADRWLELGERIALYGFDPDHEECSRLSERYSDRRHITVVPQALGSFNGPARLYLTKDPGSSSLYPPDPDVIASHPEIFRCLEPVGTSMVELVRLEDWARKAGIDRIDYLKIDVQGAELDVLMGAGKLLDGILGIEVEVEFNPMYLGQPLFSDIDRFLRSRGFTLWRLGHMVHYGHANERTDLIATQELACYDSRGFFLPGQGGTLFWGHAYYVRVQ